MRVLFVLLISLVLGACGFHLRGDVGMPFATLYLNAPESALVAELRSGLQENGVKLVQSADKADVVLNIVFEIPDKQILSLGGSGRVTEYQLRYRVSLRAYDDKQQEWIPAEELEQLRSFTYDDAAILAKQSEEAMLYQSMRSDMAQQILRRLSHAKPQ